MFKNLLLNIWDSKCLRLQGSSLDQSGGGLKINGSYWDRLVYWGGVWVCWDRLVYWEAVWVCWEGSGLEKVPQHLSVN